MNTKPQAPGQWAQQQKIAEKKDDKKRAGQHPQTKQSTGAEPMQEPRKKHGDKIDARPEAKSKTATPEDQGGIAGP